MSTATVIRMTGIAAVVLAGSFAVAVLALAPRDREFGYDSAAYVAAAERLVAGERLYPDVGRGIDGIDRGELLDDELGSFFYPPLVAVAFVPLTMLPAEAALLVWYAALIGVAIVVGVALLRRVPPDARTFAAAGYLSYLPLISELRFGNVNLLSLALVLGAWRLRDRPWVGGTLLAAGVGLKLLPVALLAFLIVAGRTRLVVAALVAGILALAVSWPWLGAAWLDWAATVRALGLETPAAASNIVPEVLRTPPWRYVLPAVALVVAAAAGLVARRAARLEDDAFTIALAAAPLLVTSVWYPYLVLALPALLTPGSARGPRYAAPAAAFAWAAIQARIPPWPLLGLVLVVATRLVAVVEPVLSNVRRLRSSETQPEPP